MIFVLTMLPSKAKWTKGVHRDNVFERKDLSVGGLDLIEAFGLKPSPFIGEILKHLLDKVLEEPSLNTKEQLLLLSSDFLNNQKRL